jgi:signal transduction histidine kinase
MNAPPTAEQIHPEVRVRHWSLQPWIVLAVGIPVSMMLYSVVRDAVENVARLRFERQASDAHSVIENRLQFYADVLYGLKALFASQQHVSRVQFHRFVEALDLKTRYPGFDLLNYAAYVPGADRRRFEESVRGDTTLDPQGYPKFTIRPPGDRSEYFVLVYLEPMAGYEFAFGRDLGANPGIVDPQALAVTMRSGRDSGTLSASGLPILVRANGKEYVGLAMRLAVYRNGMPTETVEQRRTAYIGSVGAGFNVDNIMRGVLDERNTRHLRFTVYDAGPATDPQANYSGKDRVLYDSMGRRDTDELVTGTGEAIFTHVLPTQIAGRVWKIRFSAPRTAVIDAIDQYLPMMVFMGGIVTSLLLFGVLYSLASSRSRAVTIANDMTKNLRESQEQLQALSRRQVEVQEIERRRLSSELHDRVGQNLTALSINLDILKTRMTPTSADEEIASRLDDSQHLLAATADTIDNVMSELRPPMLDDYGLHAALSWHARDFTKRTGLDVKVRGDEAGERPRPETEITLFRIAQEALNNVAKHARAKHVAIALEFRPGECIMSVADDGCGFAGGRPAANNKRQGVGMVTMRERAQAVGGTFEVRPAPGGGTQVIVRVPR